MNMVKLISREDMPIIFNLALAEGCLMMIQESLLNRGVKERDLLYRKAQGIITAIEEYAALYPGSMTDEHIAAVARTLEDVEGVIKLLNKSLPYGG